LSGRGEKGKSAGLSRVTSQVMKIFSQQKKEDILGGKGDDDFEKAKAGKPRVKSKRDLLRRAWKRSVGGSSLRNGGTAKPEKAGIGGIRGSNN